MELAPGVSLWTPFKALDLWPSLEGDMSAVLLQTVKDRCSHYNIISFLASCFVFSKPRGTSDKLLANTCNPCKHCTDRNLLIK